MNQVKSGFQNGKTLVKNRELTTTKQLYDTHKAEELVLGHRSTGSFLGCVQAAADRPLQPG